MLLQVTSSSAIKIFILSFLCFQQLISLRTAECSLVGRPHARVHVGACTVILYILAKTQPVLQNWDDVGVKMLQTLYGFKFSHAVRLEHALR